MKVGLIGIGGMGNVHFGVYKNIADVELSVADVRVDMAKEKVGDESIRVYSSIEELIDREHPDFVDICTPSYMHADMSVYAMEHGCHVLCEKPMSISTNETKRMIDAQKKTGKTFMTAHVVRFMSPYVYLKSIIDSGELGKPVHIIANRLSEAPKWSWENWMLDLDKSGGTPIDLSIHDIDFFRNAFGEPKSVKGHYHKFDGKNDYIVSLLEYDGFEVSITGGWYDAPVPFNASYLAVFEKGFVELKDGKVYNTGKEAELTRGEISSDTGINISSVDGYSDEIIYFMDCIKNGKIPEKVLPESSEASVRLVEKIIEKAMNA